MDFCDLLDFLSCEGVEKIQEIASYINDQELESPTRHEFNTVFTSVLRNTILGINMVQQKNYFDNYQELFKKYKSEKSLIGYFQVLLGVYENDQKVIDLGFEQLLKDHINLCGKGKLFGFAGRYLSVWGIGIARLVKFKGFEVNNNNELLPIGLLSI